MEQEQKTQGLEKVYSILLDESALKDAVVVQESEEIIELELEGKEKKEEKEEEKKEKISDKKIYLITKPKRFGLKKGFNIHQFLDVILFSSLFIIGVILLIVTIEAYGNIFSDSTILQTIAQLLHDAGLTPLILSLWALITGSTEFKKNNMIKASSSTLLWVIGLILMGVAKQRYLPIISLDLIEIGVLFIISRLFFLTEDSELTIERLEKQLQQARNSTGAGLALSYFYNFLLPIAKDLNTNNQLMVKLSVNGKDEEYTLVKNIMTIFLPRTLNEHDLKRADLGNTGSLKNYTSHRPLVVNYLQYWETPNDHIKYVSGMCNVPTILSSIYDRYLDVEKKKAEAKTQEELDDILDVDIQKEILDFQNYLTSLIKSKTEAKNTIRIMSTPELPLDKNKLWNAVAALDTEIIHTPR